VFSGRFSPDSSVYALSYADGTVSVNDTETGAMIYSPQETFIQYLGESPKFSNKANIGTSIIT